MVNVETLRHSTSHVLAQAVKKLFPQVKLGIGPSIEDGFYYDFDDAKFTAEDLPKIEKQMKHITKQNLPFTKKIISRKEAEKLFKDQPYKLDLIKDLKGEISVYYTGEDFFDLCSGPHVKSTGEIKAFKLTKLAGAYWRGDVKRPMLQRIYGTAFPSQAELDSYLTKLKEAAEKDHIKVGRELDLFSFHEEGPGFLFFHPKGTILYNLITGFVRAELVKRGYGEVRTPIILSKELWLRSGHWDHFRENMYFTKIDKRDFAVRPMNCPGCMLIYKEKAHSYRDLPLRLAEFGLIHRHELSGVVHGLLRFRAGHQDDAHIFCTKEQIEDEVIAMIDFIDYTYKTFGAEYAIRFSTRPKKAMGSRALWDEAEKILKKALEKKRIKYELDPGEGAFYGPKIDFDLFDALGRPWQCGTIQLDFQMPEKFNLEYAGADNKKHRPTMLHRTIVGSVERFMALVIEKYGGAFPLWLSPVQVKLLSFTDRNVEYAKKIEQEFRNAGIRIDTDYSSTTVQYKVREAEKQKIPYTIVIGDKEEKNRSLAVRPRGQKPLFGVRLETFLADLKKEIESRK